MPKCLCGCGFKVFNTNGRLFAMGWKCRVRYNTKRLKSGCLPVDEVVFGQCKNCGIDIISWKNAVRKTCQQLTGSNCAKKYNTRHLKGNKYGAGNKIEMPKKYNARPEHIFDYCMQSTGQCAEYDKGFDLDNIDGGCFGRNHTGNCYVRPTHKSMESTSNLLGVNVVGFNSPKTNMKR